MRVVSFLAVLGVTAALAAGAGAAPSRSGSLCSVGKAVATAIVASGKSAAPTTSAGSTSIASVQAAMKANFTRIHAAENTLLAASSGSIKGHLQKIFAFDNRVYSDLQKAHWSILALAKDAQALEAQAAKVKPDLLAVQKYFSKCK